MHSHSIDGRGRSLACGIGKCGACEMLVDGKVRRICVTKVDGVKEVRELAQGEKMCIRDSKKAAEPVLTDEEKLELLKAGKLPRTMPDTVDKILYKEKAYLRDIELNKELFTISFEIRKEIGDNPYDINDKKYGNPYFPLASSSKHGTHVASTIGGVPEPKSGVYGIAQRVQMMLLQVVPPGGDEEDKDIALAIRYAVDNGAKVINTVSYTHLRVLRSADERGRTQTTG